METLQVASAVLDGDNDAIKPRLDAMIWEVAQWCHIFDSQDKMLNLGVSTIREASHSTNHNN
jgi:hypothetical protein